MVGIVAPPRGERGLKLTRSPALKTTPLVAPPRGERGLKQLAGQVGKAARYVAPPRGERGLKPILYPVCTPKSRRSPSWGAWIETCHSPLAAVKQLVAPPRGERGLKLCLSVPKS